MTRTGEFRAAEAGAGARRRKFVLLGSALGILVLVLVGALVSSSLSLGAAAARASLEERLTALTGEPVFVDGTSSYELFPKPVVTLSRVRIGLSDPERPYRIDVDHVQADLDLLDALIGRPVIDEVTLIRPEAAPLEVQATEAEVFPDGDAPANGGDQARDAGAAGGDGYDALQAFSRMLLERFEGVRTLRIRDGVFRPRGGDVGVSSANLDFSWPGRREPARLVGNYVWNGQPAEIDGGIANPLALAGGEASDARLQVSSPSLSGSFTGSVRLSEMPEIKGTLQVSTPSLARTVRWLGEGTQFPEFGAFGLTTEIHLIGPRVFLGNARLDVGGFIGNGAMEAVLLPDGRPSIGGTLAFGSLDLDRFARAVAPLPRHALDLQRPIVTDFVDEFDLDLRLSASEAVLASLPARQLAATVKFANGVATLDLGDAEFLGGRASARLTIDSRQNGPTATARVSLDGASSAELADLVGISALSIEGSANLSANFAGPVSNWAEILRRNATDAKLVVLNGRLGGIDPGIFLADGERPLSADPERRQLTFQRLEAELSTRGPRMRIKTARVETPDGSIEASGTMSLLSDRISMAGSFRPQEDATEAAEDAVEGAPPFTPSQPSRFTISGEWPTATVKVGRGTEPI